jgi:hypothetical protein
MNSKLKTIIVGGFIAGSLIMSAAPVMAWDWHWFNGDQRTNQRVDNRSDHRWDKRWDQRGDNNGWGNRAGSGSDYDQWQQAHEQALYDASHGASRKKIAEDNARADEILNRTHHRH